jgi:c-di-GMP-binding flagellar brake protein YcgR
MPASRSRTERWRDSLQQIQDRNGGMEFTIARPGLDPHSTAGDLLWRVRIVKQNDAELVLEAPTAMGSTIHLNADVEVVCIFSVGQNRWMFKSKTLGMTTSAGPGRQLMPAVRIAMPTDVERCQRRAYMRVSTAEVRPITVECFPLIDPASAVEAERASRDAILNAGRESSAMPNVGPSFTATLVNIGGGGVGLMVPRDQSRGVDRSKFIWTRLDLRPELAAPLAVTGRIVHTHLNHEQDVYLGVSFEFAFHAAHRPFVGEVLVKYAEGLANQQFANRKAA